MSFVGPPSEEWRAVCEYSPTPQDPACNEPGLVHVAVESAGYGLVSLISCGRHAAAARAAGTFWNEHAIHGFCGMPGTLWSRPERACILDGSGRRAAAVAGERDRVGSR